MRRTDGRISRKSTEPQSGDAKTANGTVRPHIGKHPEEGAALDAFPRAFSDRPAVEVEIPPSNNIAMENLPQFSEKVSTRFPESREKKLFPIRCRGKMENRPSFHISPSAVPMLDCGHC